MRIGGLQKTTLLDFPGKISAVVFTQGCNFLCPYCHNPNLVLQNQKAMPLANVIAFLTQRKKVLEGVVISGGEPTLQEGLFPFCVTLKSLGYAIKLDTNGSRPRVLQLLLEAGLVDYVAMDVKGNPHNYPKEISANLENAVSQSIKILKKSGVAHEFRVPCVAPFVDAESFSAIIEEVGTSSLFLQCVRLENTLQPSFFAKKGRAMNTNEIEALCATARLKNINCQIR